MASFFGMQDPFEHLKPPNAMPGCRIAPSHLDGAPRLLIPGGIGRFPARTYGVGRERRRCAAGLMPLGGFCSQELGDAAVALRRLKAEHQ